MQPTRLSGRILVFVTCLFGIVIFRTYEADLTTRMTVQEVDIPLQSFMDIANSGKYSITTFLGGAYNVMMRSAEPGTAFGKLYRQIQTDEKKYTVHPTCEQRCIWNLLQVSKHKKVNAVTQGH